VRSGGVFWGAVLLAAAFAGGCGSGVTEVAIEPPILPDPTRPFPIDRGGEPNAPGNYKGLPLRLVERATPTITPVDGIIGVVCVGMSNGAQECNRWIQQATGPWQGEVSAAVRIVNCALGGHAIERWNDGSFDGVLWDDCINRRLGLAGVRADQVRVLYHKAANQFGVSGGSQLPAYPAANANFHPFLVNLGTFAAKAAVKFPSVRAVYTTSRSYGGFAGAGPRGEPQAYEEGHALNQWLASHSTVGGVWHGWGPYIWAPACTDGVTNASGVCYDRADFQTDAVHPSVSGELKIARMIHQRFLQESWYRP
jgi:hypothetical protein